MPKSKKKNWCYRTRFFKNDPLLIFTFCIENIGKSRKKGIFRQKKAPKKIILLQNFLKFDFQWPWYIRITMQLKKWLVTGLESEIMVQVWIKLTPNQTKLWWGRGHVTKYGPFPLKMMGRSCKFVYIYYFMIWLW